MPFHNERQCAVQTCISVADGVVIHVTVHLHTCFATQHEHELFPIEPVSTAEKFDMSTKQELLNDLDMRPVWAIRKIDDRLRPVESLVIKRVDGLRPDGHVLLGSGHKA